MPDTGLHDTESQIFCEVSDGIATVTLNRPQALNALSEAVLDGLIDTWAAIGNDRSIKVVILRGAGENFCAGHDLKEMTVRRSDSDGGRQYFIDLFAKCASMMVAMTRLPQPIIAEVQGIATAAGCQLVATCDLAVAADTARFATSGVNIGLFCSTPMVALTRAVSKKHAMEMLMTGDFFSAQVMQEKGMINRVVPDRELPDATLSLARSIASKSPVAVKIGKESFYQQSELSLEDAYAFTGRAMAENMMARDAEAGIEAFIEKSVMPEWTGE